MVQLSALRARRTLAAWILGLLLAGAAPPSPRAESRPSRPPDPVALARSCEAAVVALCIQEEGYGVPATFKVEQILSGTPPLTLHVNVVDQENLATHVSGRRYVLLVRAPRYAPFEIPSQKGRLTWPDAEAIGFPGITDQVILEGRDQATVGLARELLGLGADDGLTRRAILRSWLGRPDSSRLPGIALEGFLAHPNLWEEDLEPALLESLSGPTSNQGSMVAACVHLLARHPSAGTRKVFREKIGSGERQERQLAAALCELDLDPSVRADLVARAADPATALDVLPCLRAEHSSAERLALSNLACGRIQGVPERARADALARLGTYIGDSDWAAFLSLEETQGMDDLWPGMADSVLGVAPIERVRKSLGSKVAVLRGAAIRAAGSRRDGESGRILEDALISGRLPGGAAAGESDRIVMLESLGRNGSPRAREILVSHLHRQPPDVSGAAARGLTALGDRRAAGDLRKLDNQDCDPRHYSLNLAVVEALAQLGDSTDGPRFEAWARRCDTLRGDALEGLGLTCGMARMSALMDELTGPSADLAVVRSFSMLGAKVQARLTRRRGTN